jgi:hypothetical protein
VQNYLSHLSAVFAAARPRWGYPLNQQAMKDAQVALHKPGVVGNGKHWDRRPTLDELDKLMKHFGARPSSNPMQPIIAFAIFSTRREDEITRLAWADLDADGSRIMVRDMDHPGDKQATISGAN